MDKNTCTYIAFLRGINVGGHHKVPMAELKEEFTKLNFTNIITILNSGNVIFNAQIDDEENLEKTIENHLKNIFGFSIPVLIRKSSLIFDVVNLNPFKDIEMTKDKRLYVSFLKENQNSTIEFPWFSEDLSFQIIDVKNKSVFSVLDVSVTKTPKGMDALEQIFGKNITTRNWNTLNRIIDKLK